MHTLAAGIVLIVQVITNVMTDASAKNCCVACWLLISLSILMATLLPLCSPNHTSERKRS